LKVCGRDVCERERTEEESIAVSHLKGIVCAPVLAGQRPQVLG